MDNVFEGAYRGQNDQGNLIKERLWDLGRHQPTVETLEAAGAFSGQILEAGCGTGENVLFLVAKGHSAAGVDIAPSAIEEARRKATDRGLSATFTVGDATVSLGADDSVDTVLDSGMLHSLKPAKPDVEPEELYRRYRDALHRVCRSSALIYVLAFTDDVPLKFPGGPDLFSEAAMREVFTDPRFEVVDLKLDKILGPLSVQGRTEPLDLPGWLLTVRRI